MFEMKFNKKSIYLCILILIMLFAVSQASATEAVDNVTLDNSAEVVAVEEIDGGLDDGISDVVADSGDEEVLREVATFTELDNIIANADDGGTVELDTDYGYDPSDGEDLFYGITIDKDLTIEGNGHTIYGNGARAFWIEAYPTVTINNLTFVGEHQEKIKWGGAINNYKGHLTITNSIFMDSAAVNEGGAIYNDENSDLNIENCEFYNNYLTTDIDGGGAGGAIASYGYLYIYDSLFENNTAEFGGAVATFKESKIYNSVFGNPDDDELGNLANHAGGAVYNHLLEDEDAAQPTCYVTECKFYDNFAFNAGGGALFNVISIDSYFGDNTAAQDEETGEYMGNNMCLGVIFNCDEETLNEDDYCDVIVSDGFSFKAVSLIVNPDDMIFQVLITSTPYGEPVPGLDVWMIADDAESIVTDLYVDESDYSVFNSTNSNGIVGFQLNGLKEGDHTIYVGLDEYGFDYPSEEFKVHIGLIQSSVSGTNIIFNEGGYGSTVLTLNGATVTRPNVYVVGQSAANIQVKGNVITVSNLPAGTYYLSVKATPNYGYKESSCLIPIYVNKVYYPPVYSPPTTGGGVAKKTVTFKVKKEYGNNHKCTGLFITPKINGKAVKGLKFKIQIYTNGKVIKTVTIKSVKKIYGKKNTAFYSTNALSKGTHKVKISISTSKYKGSKTTSIIVKKKGSFENKNGHAKGK